MGKTIHQPFDFGLVESTKTLAFESIVCLNSDGFFEELESRQGSMANKLSNFYAFLRGKECPYSQFAKYVVCGGISVSIDTLVFYLFAWLVFPCMRASDPVARFLEWIGFEVRAATEDELARNFLIIKAICFVVSNGVVYLLNVLFVFEAGRHKKVFEIMMFFGASLFQFFFIWLGRVLISDYGWEVTYSNIAMLAVGVVVNYFVRKFLIFKR